MAENKIQSCQARVRSNKEDARNIFRLELEGCKMGIAKPGQFVCLAPLDHSSAMARPFSIFFYDMFAGFLVIYYKAVGKNTELMKSLQAGQSIKLWGPLGNGISSDGIPRLPGELRKDISVPEGVTAWLICGGMGFASLNLAIRELNQFYPRSVLFYGSKTKSEIVSLEKDPYRVKQEIIVATEDGTAGYAGLVTDLFVQQILENPGKKILVITCGPKPMMRKVAEICEGQEFDCYVILETIMACGIGACLGCSIKTTKGMKRICHDGPVFDAKEVIWDELA